MDIVVTIRTKNDVWKQIVNYNFVDFKIGWITMCNLWNDYCENIHILNNLSNRGIVKAKIFC